MKISTVLHGFSKCGNLYITLALQNFFGWFSWNLVKRTTLENFQDVIHNFLLQDGAVSANQRKQRQQQHREPGAQRRDGQRQPCRGGEEEQEEQGQETQPGRKTGRDQ